MGITHQQVAEMVLIMIYITAGIITIYAMDKGGWFGNKNNADILTGWQTLLRAVLLVFWPIVVVFPVGIWYSISKT